MTPEPHPRGPLPFPPTSPTWKGLGPPIPEAAPKAVQEEPAWPLVFSLGNLSQPPILQSVQRPMEIPLLLSGVCVGGLPCPSSLYPTLNQGQAALQG